jgi:long-chain fatty acid transport protein
MIAPTASHMFNPPSGPRTILTAALLCGVTATGEANGIYRNGIGARAMALGGADTTLNDSALSAMTANPAALSDMTGIKLDLGLTAALPDGEFSNSANAPVSLRDQPGLFPEFALTLPYTDEIKLGFSVSPEAMLAGKWDYVDAPGGLSGTTSYGRLRHRSEIVVLRSAFGVGISLADNLSIGGSVGLLYNRNQLETAYVFQSHPALRGFKTLVDLDTDGFGVDGEFGVLYRPLEELHFAVTYKLASTVKADGRITGNAGAELAALGGDFAGVRPDFAYDAEVENTFPQMLSAGLGWQATPDWRLLAQVDWINWSDAFDAMPLRLRNGNNADLNEFLGSDAIDDTIPLNWKDRFVYRAGVEFTPGRHWSFRAGYSYGKSPVPDGTLNPLNAAIFEHTLGAGVGYRWKRFSLDAAWQWDLPARQSVVTSDLESGEYANSSVEVEVHGLALTAGLKF